MTTDHVPTEKAAVVVAPKENGKPRRAVKGGSKWVLTSAPFLTIDSYLTPPYTMRVKAGPGFDVIKELMGGGGQEDEGGSQSTAAAIAGGKPTTYAAPPSTTFLCSIKLCVKPDVKICRAGVGGRIFS